jgi:AbrB family looped-hinge helix DNA binding protein
MKNIRGNFGIVIFFHVPNMKSTGIVRKVDELGRVVIPKETRELLSIDESNSLEIFEDENEIILKKIKCFSCHWKIQFWCIGCKSFKFISL